MTLLAFFIWGAFSLPRCFSCTTISPTIVYATGHVFLLVQKCIAKHNK